MPSKKQNLKSKSKLKSTSRKKSAQDAPEPSRVHANGDQYHHTVPRFILRRFQVGERKSSRQRNKEYRRTGVDPDKILYYDLATKTLESCPISSVFGVKNLYRDVRNTENVNELEVKLAGLENKAAALIKQFHKDLPKGESSLMRKEVEDLRKFLFLMHYRSAALSLSYFEPTHPGNSSACNWIEQVQKHLGLSSGIEIWLHFLRYFLDTPHSQIVDHAMEKYKKFGVLEIARMLNAQIDPAVEHFEAIAYQNQAGMFFLCVWEAADGEEFVLGSNAFGLWEGRMGGEPCLHRLFVVSPRIVVVLRNNVLREEDRLPAHLLSSDFLDINQEPPVPRYASGQAGLGSVDELLQHKASANAEKDVFIFNITKLTREQTRDVNFVVLENVHSNSAITFVSKPAMLLTVREFCQSPLFYRIPYRAGYEPLIQQLSTSEEGPSLPTSSTHISGSASSSNASVRVSRDEDRSGIDGKLAAKLGRALISMGNASSSAGPSAEQSRIKAEVGHDKANSGIKDEDSAGPERAPESRGGASESETEAEKRLRLLIQELLNKRSEDSVSSPYDKAYDLFYLCTFEDNQMNPFSSEYRRLTSSVVERMFKLLKPPPLTFRPRPDAKLVRKLPKDKSDLLFSILDLYMKRLGYEVSEGEIARGSSMWLRRTVYIGFLSAIAKSRYDVLDSLCPGIQLIRN